MLWYKTQRDKDLYADTGLQKQNACLWGDKQGLEPVEQFSKADRFAGALTNVQPETGKGPEKSNKDSKLEKLKG